MLALEKIQDAFEGEAERLGLKTEEDVVKMIKNQEKKERRTRMRVMLDTNILVSNNECLGILRKILIIKN